MKEQELIQFYQQAKQYVIANNYQWEIDIVEQRKFSDTTANSFFNQAVFVILNTAMKNQIAEQMFRKFIESNYDMNLINHEQKKLAIIKWLNNHIDYFEKLKTFESERSKIEYLETLPFIGKITKYHLARNIGLDCAKPDRHLVTLASHFEFPTPRTMCEWLASKVDERIGTVDVILWRSMNLGFRKELFTKTKQITL